MTEGDALGLGPAATFHRARSDRVTLTAILPHAVLLMLSSACGAAGYWPPPFAEFHNGGSGPSAPSCNDIGARLNAAGVRVWPAAAACADEREFGVPVGAAFAYFQTETSAVFVGPIVASPMRVTLHPRMSAGAGSREIAAGSGSAATTVASGSSGVSAASGSSGVLAGSGATEVQSGDGRAGPDVGGAAVSTQSGASSASLAAGSGSSRSVTLLKVPNAARLLDGDSGTFTLTLQNDASLAIANAVVVDRVSAVVEVLEWQGAERYRLADQSTLLVWRSTAPVRPGSALTYSVRFRVRPPTTQ